MSFPSIYRWRLIPGMGWKFAPTPTCISYIEMTSLITLA